MFKNSGSGRCTGNLAEPEFLNILKCNLAESARAGFQFDSHFLMMKHLIKGIWTTFHVC
jgi:hypothetical protein